MSQDQLLEKVRSNPGIKQCQIIDSKTTFNSRMLKTLLRKGLIRREIRDHRYHLYLAEER